MSEQNNQNGSNLGSVTSGLLLATSLVWLAGVASVRALSEGKNFKPAAFVVSTVTGIAAGLTLSFAMAAHNGARGPSETQDTPRESPAATQLKQARTPVLPTVLTAKA